jgi:hypothetical protein
LVSAIAIFGTFQLFDAVAWATDLFIDVIPFEQHLIGYMVVFMGLFAVSILSVMFSVAFSILFIYISSLMMMGPLHKNILQVLLIFGTNFKKNKVLVKLIILFGCIGFFCI